jgi:hypothetical protein
MCVRTVAPELATACMFVCVCRFLLMSRPALPDGVKMEVQAKPTSFVRHTGAVCGNGTAHAACDFDRHDGVFVRERA